MADIGAVSARRVKTASRGDSTEAICSVYVLIMRLSEYPYVVVRIGCSKCSRKGAYKLARLADRYGAEAEIQAVLSQLAGDCAQRDVRLCVHDFCGAFFPDLSGGGSPDMPRAAPTKPKLRAVK